MIKHFCDICNKEISSSSRVNDVTLLVKLNFSQFAVSAEHDDNCELCITCANTIIRTIDMMKRGKEVIYK